jgi:hypothetical protein
MCLESALLWYRQTTENVGSERIVHRPEEVSSNVNSMSSKQQHYYEPQAAVVE